MKTIKETNYNELEEKFHQTIVGWKLRQLNKKQPVSQAALYNYAISLSQIEFNKKLDDRTLERLVESYKP